jgi:hypothetical protein
MIDLVKVVNEYGAKNLRFFIPLRRVQVIGFIAFTSSDTPEDIVECEIDESRYQVADNYKIGLKSVVPGYGSQNFYICDLQSILSRDDRYKVYVVSIDGYSRLDLS